MLLLSTAVDEAVGGKQPVGLLGTAQSNRSSCVVVCGLLRNHYCGRLAEFSSRACVVRQQMTRCVFNARSRLL